MFRPSSKRRALLRRPSMIFYAFSRFADVDESLVDHASVQFSAGHHLELIKANLDIPPGMLIMEDPPIHDVHRKLLAQDAARAKRCARAQDSRILRPVAGPAHRIRTRRTSSPTCGAQMPMKVISMLLGIPEDDQEFIRDRTNAQLRTEAGKPAEHRRGLHPAKSSPPPRLARHASVRRHHDRTAQRRIRRRDGITRQLTRDELLIYLNVVAGAGNETTTRLIGWGRKGSRRTSGPASRNGPRPGADTAGHRRTAALRATGTAHGPVR